MYKVHLTLQNRKHEDIGYKTTNGERASGAGWGEVSVSITVPEEFGPAMQEARYLVVQNDGKDNQFWAGHYGTKFSRISVFVRCLTEAEVRQIAEQEQSAGDLNANEPGANPEMVYDDYD